MKNRALVAALAAGLVCIASQAFAFERLDRLILNAVSGGGYGCGCDNACGKDMACGCDRGCHHRCHRDRCCRDRCHRGCGLFGHHGCGCDTAVPTCEAKGVVQAPSCEGKAPSCGYEAACGCDRGCRDRCHRGCFSFCHRDRCGGCGWFGGHHGCGCEAKCGCGY